MMENEAAELDALVDGFCLLACAYFELRLVEQALEVLMHVQEGQRAQRAESLEPGERAFVEVPVLGIFHKSAEGAAMVSSVRTGERDRGKALVGGEDPRGAPRSMPVWVCASEIASARRECERA